MVDLQTLFRTVDELNNEELQQLSRYILEKQEHLSENDQPHSLKPRILGLHEPLGHAWMSADFNAELPESFWLGEDSP